MIEIFPKRFLKHKVMISQEKIIVILAESETLRDVKAILAEFLIDYARKHITFRVEYYAKKHDFKFNKIAIKDQRSRWGSCSSLSNLNFNWRLIFAPTEISDYVIVHELSHTKQMNHSARFWNIVAECMPEYKIRNSWLKENGKYLFKMF